MQTARTLAAGVAALQAQLIVTAPIDGRVSDLADPLRPGQWVRPKQVLGQVAVGALARFIANDPAAAARLRVETLATANADTLDVPYLSASHGGPIPVVPAKGGRGPERPGIAVYRATLVPDGPVSAPDQTAAGRVFIDGPPLSLAERVWRAAAAVVIRESGF